MRLQWQKAPYGRKGIFVDIDKGCQGAGRWYIDMQSYAVKLNGVKRYTGISTDDAKARVAWETNTES